MRSFARPFAAAVRASALGALLLAGACAPGASGSEAKGDAPPPANAAPSAGYQSMVPVDMPIPNLRQETEVWCWAAVAQQIILASVGPEKTPPQCALVAAANGVSADVCCNGYNQQCVRTGSLEQIQGLIQRFAGRSSQQAGPADPSALYNALAGGHAVVVGMQLSPTTYHVVVVRGMGFAQTPSGPEPMVALNDPMQIYTQAVPFQTIAPYWQTAIIIN